MAIGKKQIFLIAASLLLFGTAGYVLYQNFSNTNAANTVFDNALGGQMPSVGSPSKILPYGVKLDFGIINKYNPAKKLFLYSHPSPEDTRGINNLNDLIQ